MVNVPFDNIQDYSDRYGRARAFEQLFDADYDDEQHYQELFQRSLDKARAYLREYKDKARTNPALVAYEKNIHAQNSTREYRFKDILGLLLLTMREPNPVTFDEFSHKVKRYASDIGRMRYPRNPLKWLHAEQNGLFAIWIMLNRIIIDLEPDIEDFPDPENNHYPNRGNPLYDNFYAVINQPGIRGRSKRMWQQQYYPFRKTRDKDYIRNLYEVCTLPTLAEDVRDEDDLAASRSQRAIEDYRALPQEERDTYLSDLEAEFRSLMASRRGDAS